MKERTMADIAYKLPSEQSLTFTHGLIFGQLSVILILVAFIRYFICGQSTTPETTTSLDPEKQPATSLPPNYSLFSLRGSSHRSSQSLKKSSILTDPANLSIGAILSKTYYNVHSHQPESLDWFNVLIAQTIAQFRSDAQHDDAILDSLTKALNGPSRPDFVDEIRIKELSLGDDFPIFSNCRVMPVDDDGVVSGKSLIAAAALTPKIGTRLEARMDVDLSDILTLALETKLLLNFPRKLSAILPVALAVSIVKFSGTLSISFIPSNPSHSTPTTMTFSFLDDYRLEFSTKSLLGSRAKLQDIPKLAQLIEARLRRWFNERAVAPRFQEIALPSLWPRKRNTRGPDDPSTESLINRTKGKANTHDEHGEDAQPLPQCLATLRGNDNDISSSLRRRKN